MLFVYLIIPSKVYHREQIKVLDLFILKKETQWSLWFQLQHVKEREVVTPILTTKISGQVKNQLFFLDL